MSSYPQNGPGAAVTARGPATEGATPVTHAYSHGSPTRRPVYTGNRRVPGLYERTLANGSTVYDAALRLGGKVRRHRLRAITKTDAINELRALQVDYGRGEEHRSPAAGLPLDDLAADYITHLRARTNETDPRRRRSPRTVEHYESQLRLHVLPLLGRRPVAELTTADVRRLLDALAAKRLSPRSRGGLLGILSSVLTYGVRQGAVPHNVVRDLGPDDRPGAQRQSEPRYLDPDELDRLLGRMGDTFRPVAATCAYAGLRLSEALGLRWRDVDLGAGTHRDRPAWPGRNPRPTQDGGIGRHRAATARLGRGTAGPPLARGRPGSCPCPARRARVHNLAGTATRAAQRAPGRVRGR
jgi:integrase